MKGVIFTEFLDYVEAKLDPTVLAQLDAEGFPRQSYSPIETYDLDEFSHLIERVCAIQQSASGDLLRGFGCHLFRRFAALYPVFVNGTDSALEFLANIDTSIHAELIKLYPDAEFPRFECRFRDPRTLEMTYNSQRSLADFAEGLILGCLEHFHEGIELRRENLSNDGSSARFLLSAVAAS